MRHSVLAVSATVLLGVGTVTARVGAQTQTVPVPLSQRVQIDITQKNAPLNKAEAARLLLIAKTLRESEGNGPIDCGMPKLEGDPAVDPLIVKQPPRDGVKHSLGIIKFVPCPSRR